MSKFSRQHLFISHSASASNHLFQIARLLREIYFVVEFFEYSLKTEPSGNGGEGSIERERVPAREYFDIQPTPTQKK